MAAQKSSPSGIFQSRRMERLPSAPRLGRCRTALEPTNINSAASVNSPWSVPGGRWARRHINHLLSRIPIPKIKTMTTNKLLYLACIAAVAASCLVPRNLSAQDAKIPSVPAPTPGVRVPEVGPTARFTMDDGKGVILNIRGPQSRRVLLRPGHTTTVILQYDRSWAGVALEAAALDGGKLQFPGNRKSINASGKVVLQFGDAQQPGLYRVVVNCGGIASTLQFWVPDPDGSGVDASVLVPTVLPAPAPNSQ